MSGNITKKRLSDRRKGKTDWKRVDALTDADISNDRLEVGAADLARCPEGESRFRRGTLAASDLCRFYDDDAKPRLFFLSRDEARLRVHADCNRSGRKACP